MITWTTEQAGERGGKEEHEASMDNNAQNSLF